MKDIIYVSPEGIGVANDSECYVDMSKLFSSVPDVAKPLCGSLKKACHQIEKMLYEAPAFLNLLKARVPEGILQAVLTDEQKLQLAEGSLKLMSKQDGSLLACLVNPETNKIVANVPLQEVNLSPDFTQALANFSTQMQLAQITEQIQKVQRTIEAVLQGQENDRLAAAHSCQQNLLQVMVIKNPQLKSAALLQVALEAEKSRNLLMLSQSANIKFIKELPEDTIGKLRSKVSLEEKQGKLKAIYTSLYAVNMVSLAEAMAYQELGETESAQISLQYYADYIHENYLQPRNFIERLSMMDELPQNDWKQTLFDIAKRIQALPCNVERILIGGNEDGAAEM